MSLLRTKKYQFKNWYSSTSILFCQGGDFKVFAPGVSKKFKILPWQHIKNIMEKGWCSRSDPSPLFAFIFLTCYEMGSIYVLSGAPLPRILDADYFALRDFYNKNSVNLNEYIYFCSDGTFSWYSHPSWKKPIMASLTEVK